MDSYNWAGCRAKSSPNRTNIKPQGRSVGIPTISEFIKFPNLIRHPANATTITTLSKVHK